MKTDVPQRVVCAANRCKDTGAIVLGIRHYCPLMRANISAMNITNLVDFEQGFVDQRGNFLTREEAHVIATREGQIVRRVGGDRVKLFSENLY